MQSRLSTIILISIFIIASAFGCSKDSGVSSGSAGPGTTGSGKAGSLARFAIVGDYLYALDGKYIMCFDISASNTPVLKNKVQVAFDIETIYPYQDKLFIGSTTGMYAYSLANPASPALLSSVSHVRACDPVAVQGNYAYVTLRSGTNCGGNNLMNVYNVTNINSPQLVKTINLNQPYGLGISGNALYVTNPLGIKLFSIAQPDAPALVSDINETTASDVIPYNNTLIVQLAKGAAFYDISNVQSPSFLSRITQ